MLVLPTPKSPSEDVSNHNLCEISGKLGQQAVAGSLDHPAAVFGDGRVVPLAMQRFLARDGAGLVGAHEP